MTRYMTTGVFIPSQPVQLYQGKKCYKMCTKFTKAPKILTGDLQRKRFNRINMPFSLVLLTELSRQQD